MSKTKGSKSNLTLVKSLANFFRNKHSLKPQIPTSPLSPQTNIAEQRIHKRIAKKTTTKKKPMVNKAWKIIPRPLLETILNNHAQHHRVPQPLILHGPRGVGKTTLILDRTAALSLSLISFIFQREKFISSSLFFFCRYSW